MLEKAYNRYYQIIMITIIFGLPRKGKTALMTKFALENMTGYNARLALKNCHSIVSKYNNGGFKFSLPEKHLVHADYTISARHGKITQHYVDGFYLGLPDPFHETLFLPPYSYIYLDEAQKYFNSRNTKIADSVSRFYELHGQFHFNITLACQRPKLIDLNIRELAERVIEVVDLKHIYEHGKIVGSIWICHEYEKCVDAVKFVEGQKVDYNLVNYEFNGNIFKHYDSFFFEKSFLNERYNKDFDIYKTGNYSCDIDDVRRFNAEHSYTIPKGYYKGV